MNKGKIKRTLWPGIRDSFSVCRSERKGIILICGLAVITRVAAPFLNILMPKVVLDQIAATSTPERFLLVVGGLALLLVLSGYLKAFSDMTMEMTVGVVIIDKILFRRMSKAMTMDYEVMESPEFIAVRDKAAKASYSNHAPAMCIPKSAVELLSNSLGFLLYASSIFLVHPLIPVILLITAGLNWLMLSRARRYMESTSDKRSRNGKRLDALRDMLRKPEAAKDIRLYGAFGWLAGLYKSQLDVYRKDERKLLTKNMQVQLADALMILLRDGAAYIFLIWLVLNDRLSPGDFVFIFAATGALAGWISGILAAASGLSKACIEMNDVQAEFEFPDKMNTGQGIPLPAGPSLPPSIELRGAGYTYPNAEKAALSRVSAVIGAGERVAVVGLNGAGKTTLIKLICGLYNPTEGEVLLNGNPAGEYNRDEYYTLFSAIFQDIHLMSASILENISQRPRERTDLEKVRRCMELAGLDEKVGTLADGEETLLVRAVNPGAAVLSGGEMQKLAMARALYDDAPVLILDEPTAALDPLAENEVYRRYAQLTQGKTSVYISHRLASTRFCDRILLLDGCAVAEQGTHDELMALGGIYAKMFNMQASYYN